jgi:UDP-N-acetylmuramoyl-tripeptide--D-alanyl-D-alanine ligase
MLNAFLVVACLAATVTAAPRWLRVAQREHYVPQSATRFAARWWGSSRENLLLAMGALGGALAALSVPGFSFVTAVVVAVAPLGLGLRGRTSKLVWTRRLKTLAAVDAVLVLAVFGLSLAAGDAGPGLAAMAAFASPLLLDLALAVTQPFEKRAARRYVTSAERKLRSANPVTVAITGSYGKTTTKQYVRHLVSGLRTVLASPASFNNTGGLSRTLNEQLVPGTEVFVAEMGMWGPGEIRAMCAWVRPTIGVIANIGPVHLERVGSLDGIVDAKAEICEGTPTCVLNVSAHRLAEVADRLEREGKRVIRVATEATVVAEVVVVAGDDGSLDVRVGDRRLTVADTTAQAANVAAALGVVLALDLPVDAVLGRLDSLPQPENRQAVSVSAAGVTVVDNTFSSNPASAAASLALLDRVAPRRARITVVTPGMVELGPVQFEENRRFAAAAGELASDVVIVGNTNKKALLAGLDPADVQVHLARTRDAAVAWVRANLGEGDAVLYENDLPDHYP